MNEFDSVLFIFDRINRIYWIFLSFVSGGNKRYPDHPVNPV
jgi:hypothetical protein